MHKCKECRRETDGARADGKGWLCHDCHDFFEERRKVFAQANKILSMARQVGRELHPNLNNVWAMRLALHYQTL